MQEQPFNIDEFFASALATDLNFMFIVLEKGSEKEEDELKHCLGNVKTMFQEYPNLLKERIYNEPQKNSVTFSLDKDLKKGYTTNCGPERITGRKLKMRCCLWRKREFSNGD